MDSTYICPICGKSLYRREHIYVDRDHEIVGCDYCLMQMDAEDGLEESDENLFVH